MATLENILHMEEEHNKRGIKVWQNMMDGKCFVKGVRDSKTKYVVLATRNANNFGPEVCYIDYVVNLPYGTCYVDSE